MNRVLVYSELRLVALELLSFAAGLECPAAVALFGPGAVEWAPDCFAHGANTAYTSVHKGLAHAETGAVSEALLQVARQAEADVILVGSTLRGREVAARLAQKLAAGCITDANGLRFDGGVLTATRYSLGGNTVSTERIKTAQQVIAVMPRTFQARPARVAIGQVVEVRLAIPPSRVKLVERRPKPPGSANVESAKVLVCIGRGVKSPEDLDTIEALATELGGVIGCTRPLSHERHWLSEDRMIGISGRSSSPRLYLGIGLSGQIQHTVGITGAKVTVAINKDKEAPVFKMADYGIVGDLYEVVPKLTEGVRERHTKA